MNETTSSPRADSESHAGFLRTVEAFSGVRPEWLERLDKLLVTVKLDADEMVFQTGQLSDAVYVVQRGTVAVFTDTTGKAVRLIEKTGPRQLLGLIGSPREIDPAVDGAEYGNYGDPLETYPIDTGRLAAVAELAAEKAGWGRELPPGVGMGIAAHRSFLSYVAVVLAATVDGDSVRVDEAHVAIDCGTVLNADRVHAQLEGSVIFGLGLALRSEITAATGAITQSNFHDYEILRITETPRALETYIVESAAPPGGVGEPGVPPVAPALANAIYAASGRRLRELPLLKALRT